MATTNDRPNRHRSYHGRPPRTFYRKSAHDGTSHTPYETCSNATDKGSHRPNVQNKRSSTSGNQLKHHHEKSETCTHHANDGDLPSSSSTSAASAEVNADGAGAAASEERSQPNIWKERLAFRVLPKNAEEEEEMVRKAMELSALEAEQSKRQITGEEHNLPQLVENIDSDPDPNQKEATLKSISDQDETTLKSLADDDPAICYHGSRPPPAFEFPLCPSGSCQGNMADCTGGEDDVYGEAAMLCIHDQDVNTAESSNPCDSVLQIPVPSPQPHMLIGNNDRAGPSNADSCQNPSFSGTMHCMPEQERVFVRPPDHVQPSAESPELPEEPDSGSLPVEDHPTGEYENHFQQQDTDDHVDHQYVSAAEAGFAQQHNSDAFNEDFPHRDDRLDERLDVAVSSNHFSNGGDNTSEAGGSNELGHIFHRGSETARDEACRSAEHPRSHSSSSSSLPSSDNGMERSVSSVSPPDLLQSHSRHSSESSHYSGSGMSKPIPFAPQPMYCPPMCQMMMTTPPYYNQPFGHPMMFPFPCQFPQFPGYMPPMVQPMMQMPMYSPTMITAMPMGSIPVQPFVSAQPFFGGIPAMTGSVGPCSACNGSGQSPP